MNFKILKKDLKRKKSMNIILTIFILLATMFIASSVNNLVVIMNGTESYFNAAGLEDYLIVTMRENYNAPKTNEDNIMGYLKESSMVDRVSADDVAYMGKSNVKFDNDKTPNINSTMILSCYKINQQKFFDENNNVITNMEDGTIYMPEAFMEDNGLVIGDDIGITTRDGWEKSFTIVGIAKDAFLGSEMMGTHRYLLSENDFDSILKEGGLPVGNIFSVKGDNPDKLQKEINKQDFNALFTCGRSVVKTSYIMDMVVAAVLLLVSLCLIIISIVMLRFIIVFTVNEDFREIGIMKAIGIKNSGIRGLYITKYFVIAIMGAAMGFAGSIPFGKILLAQVTKSIVIKDTGNNIILPLISSLAVAGVITLFAYISTGRIKKLSPMDVIRNGNNGERFKKKGFITLGKSKLKTTTFLAVNDVMSELRKYMVLLITSMVGMWLVIMPVNTINTLQSEKIAKWFSLLDCHMYISSDEKIADCIVAGDKQAFVNYMDNIKLKLEDNQINVDRIFMEVLFKYRIVDGDNSYNSFAIQGIGTKADEYMYEDGEAPEYENEVALAYGTAKALNARIGDTVYIMINGEEKPFVISGFYQSMNNMGDGIRFNENTKLDYGAASGAFGVQVVMTDNPDSHMVESTIEKAKDIFPEANIEDVKGFVSSMIGNVSERIAPLKILILSIVMAINVLVVVLMQKMFLIRERGEMGMLKAVGFSNGSIIAWQTKRIVLVLFSGIVLGTLTGTPFSQITSGQVFKIMGASKVQFVINPLEVYVIYPLAVFFITVIACILTMRKVTKITAQDINIAE